MTDTRPKCAECFGRGIDGWGGTCCTCGGQGREPFREHGKEDDEDNPHEHKSWCAAVIAANAELPWRVKCDCKRTPKSAPRSIGSLPSGESDPSVMLDFRGAGTWLMFECPDCGKDIADTETKHAAGCAR